MNDPEADYYRLRTEWLRFKSHLFDGLTNLPSLPGVIEDVRKLLEAQRGVEVVYVDLGRSGWHERELGWAAYDRVVKEFAGALRLLREKGVLSPHDVVCLNTVRSDRFLVFLAGGEAAMSAAARRDRLMQSIRGLIAEAPVGSALRSVRLAAGHARVGEHPMTRTERAIQHAVAEAILISLAEREGIDAARHEDLSRIIHGAGIRSVFHPILRLADGFVLGHEALSRVFLPNSFDSVEGLFAYAESTDLIVAFERVCRATAIRSALTRTHPGLLFLNASARAVLDPEWFSGETAAQLRAAGLRPQDVVVEITERMAVGRHDGFEQALRSLKERGYRVAVDDMGAGHASLQTLASIEPDFLKFDTSLVRDIDKSSIKRSLLESLRMLADKIHARVIAEGVEREGERATLLALGIEYGQGFLFHTEGY